MPATIRADVVFLHPDDNVCIAARNLAAGEEISVAGNTVRLKEAIKLGHKVAILPIGKDQRVLRYGQTMGATTKAIEPGQHVHSHNLVQGDFTRDYASSTAIPPPPVPIS